MYKSVTIAALLAFSVQLAAPVLVHAQVSAAIGYPMPIASPINGPIHLLKGAAQENRVTESDSKTDGQATASDGPIVIDNDEEKDKSNTSYQWKELPDASGKTQIESGAQFPVSIVSAHSSKTAKVGDAVDARLKVDIKIGGKLIAPKGATVIGHIASCERARKMIKAELSHKRWLKPSGALGLQFDEIVTPAGDHLPLVAQPAKQASIIKNDSEGRLLGVNSHGQIELPQSYQIKRQALQLAIRAGASAAGVFSFGAVPVCFGVLGAINPSLAFMHPVGTNVRHRRLKGFGMGVISGLPGGFLLADSINKGEEAVIQPGDEFLAEFKQNFTGEAATEAQLGAGVKIKVHGEVLPDKSI
jgi:Tfp pilus assembly major pilin PilA